MPLGHTVVTFLSPLWEIFILQSENVIVVLRAQPKKRSDRCKKIQEDWELPCIVIKQGKWDDMKYVL